ncbi:MAG: hypothetical protein ACP5DC_07735 [Halothiobacillaceae bacterium]
MKRFNARMGLAARSWRLPMLAFLLLGLAACAVPRYETTVSYLPPADEAGRACVAGCSEALTACQSDCAERWNACSRSVEPVVQQRFNEAVRQYEILRDQYETDRLFYQINRSLSWGWGYGAGYYGPGPFGWTEAYDAPVPPPAPSMDEIRDRLVSERCDARCDCQAGYDRCFLGCGGQIDRATRCVAHCGGVTR